MLAGEPTRFDGARRLGALLGGVALAYWLAFIRIENPAERTHLLEYGIVAVLVYQALTERSRNGGRVPAPAILAIIVTALLGWVDEGIQAVLPNRVYDIRDVGFNTLAGLMAITVSVVFAWVSQRGKPRQD